MKGKLKVKQYVKAKSGGTVGRIEWVGPHGMPPEPYALVRWDKGLGLSIIQQELLVATTVPITDRIGREALGTTHAQPKGK